MSNFRRWRWPHHKPVPRPSSCATPAISSIASRTSPRHRSVLIRPPTAFVTRSRTSPATSGRSSAVAAFADPCGGHDPHQRRHDHQLPPASAAAGWHHGAAGSVPHGTRSSGAATRGGPRCRAGPRRPSRMPGGRLTYPPMGTPTGPDRPYHPPTLWVLPDQIGMRGPMAHEFPRYRQNRHFIIIGVKTHGFGGLQAHAG